MAKKITTNEGLLKYLEQGFKDIDSLEDVTFDPNLLTLHLKIKGDNYDGSITPPIMKSLLAMQEELYRIYRDYLGETRLTKEQKLAIDFIVTVDSGCSDILIKFTELFDVFKKAIGDMTSTHKMATVITLGFFTTVGVIAYKGFDYHTLKNTQNMEQQIQKMQNEKDKRQHDKDIMAMQLLANSADRTTQARANSLKALIPVAEHNSLSIDDVEVSPEVLKERIAAVPEKVDTSEDAVITGRFLIKAMYTNFENQTGEIEVHNTESEEIIKNVKIYSRAFFDNTHKILEQSENKTPLDLQLIVTVDKGIIIKASLDKIIETTKQ